jgi:hypothetical protein
MTRASFQLKARIVDIACIDEADGAGSAEPYLWPVFFKIDGDTYAVDSVGLIGFPKIIKTNGAHGNLGTKSVGAGNTVRVPEAIGTQTITLKPIPINNPSLKPIVGDDLPGIAGVVAILMEEDNWPDDFATTGYDALVDAVHLTVLKVTESLQFATSVPTQAEINQAIAKVKESAKKMIKGALLEHMSGAQIVYFGGAGDNDDTIGTEVWTINQDDFFNTKDGSLKVNPIIFQRRWDNKESEGNGDWVMTVEFTNLDAPPKIDTQKCAELAAQIKQKEQELKASKDSNEKKLITRTIQRLKDEAARARCPGFTTEPPPPEDKKKKCADLAAQIKAKEKEKKQTTDPNEKKLIALTIQALKDESKLLGCPGF